MEDGLSGDLFCLVGRSLLWSLFATGGCTAENHEYVFFKRWQKMDLEKP